MIQIIFGSPVVVLHNNLENLFTQEVYDKTIECLMSNEHKFVNHPFTRGGKICTTDLDSEMELFAIEGYKNIFEQMKQTALQYVNLYSTESVKDLEFTTAWINLMYQGCEIKNHNDRYYNSERSLIVTFYPVVPKNSSNLVFIHNSQEGQWASDCREQDLVRLAIEQGDIVIFDNSILHAVDPHASNDTRMCIATEFKIVK